MTWKLDKSSPLCLPAIYLPVEYLLTGIIAIVTTEYRSYRMDEFDQEFDSQEFLTRLGAHIAKVRASKGYSQDRVCLEAGFARGTLSKIENGLVDPKASTLARTADTIGVPLKKLMDIDL